VLQLAIQSAGNLGKEKVYTSSSFNEKIADTGALSDSTCVESLN
jgi:hypothetical protein